MTVIIIIVLFVGFSFGSVVFFGAPYLPTLAKQTEVALELADLQAGETLLELGCGDGRVMLAAAKRGWQVVGYELNPILVLICKLRTWRYRRLVSVKWGNFLTQDWPPAEAIFIFGLQRLMPKLDKKIMQSVDDSVKQVNVKLVSFAFNIPEKQPVRSQDGLFLYIYT